MPRESGWCLWALPQVAGTPDLFTIEDVQITSESGRPGGFPHCSKGFATSKPPGRPLGSPTGHFYSSFSVLSGGRNEEGEVLSFFKFKMTFKITSLVFSSRFIIGETEAWS